MSAPRRTLTVTNGRKTIGYINEMASHNFVGLVAPSGERLGPFKTQGDVALAINNAHAAKITKGEKKGSAI